jgi:hypothetical protein
MADQGSAKCVACEGIFRKAELADDGRCKECVKADKKPKRPTSGGSFIINRRRRR